MGLRNEFEKKIFEDISKYLDREKAKKLLEEETRLSLDGVDYSDEEAARFGEAVIYLDGIGERDKVREEIFNSDWYRSYFDEKGNQIKGNMYR